MPAKILGAILLLIVLLQVRADYQLQVTVHRFTIDVNCDARLDSTARCDVYFSICQRALATSIDSSNTECPKEEVTSETRRNVERFVDHTFHDRFFGLTNPIILKGSQWVGVQLYLLVIDDDRFDDDLTDILAIDINIPVGESIDRTTYTGQRDNTQLDLSFRVVCAPNYYGPNCLKFCSDISCPCDPGFTGEFCETEVNINICDSINCNNGYCVNRTTNSYTCVCDPGFTGEFCETVVNINQTNSCDSINCNNGYCENRTPNSYTCVCNPGFSGEFCEKTIEPLNETAGCEVNGCSGNGECLQVDSVGDISTYECTCDPGFSGRSCEKGQATQSSKDIVGPVTGSIFGAILLILIVIVIVIVVVVLKGRLKQTVTKSYSQSEAQPPEMSVQAGAHDNPVYGMSENKTNTLENFQMNASAFTISELNDPGVAGTTRLNGSQQPASQHNTGSEEAADFEKELKNPIYGMD